MWIPLSAPARPSVDGHARETPEGPQNYPRKGGRNTILYGCDFQDPQDQHPTTAALAVLQMGQKTTREKVAATRFCMGVIFTSTRTSTRRPPSRRRGGARAAAPGREGHQAEDWGSGRSSRSGQGRSKGEDKGGRGRGLLLFRRRRQRRRGRGGAPHPRWRGGSSRLALRLKPRLSVPRDAWRRLHRVFSLEYLI